MLVVTMDLMAITIGQEIVQRNCSLMTMKLCLAKNLIGIILLTQQIYIPIVILG
ncbi:hypothetical protein D3C81_1788350 [compost metagenome]